MNDPVGAPERLVAPDGGVVCELDADRVGACRRHSRRDGKHTPQAPRAVPRRGDGADLQSLALLRRGTVAEPRSDASLWRDERLSIRTERAELDGPSGAGPRPRRDVSIGPGAAHDEPSAAAPDPLPSGAGAEQQDHRRRVGGGAQRTPAGLCRLQQPDVRGAASVRGPGRRGTGDGAWRSARRQGAEQRRRANPDRTTPSSVPASGSPASRRRDPRVDPNGSTARMHAPRQTSGSSIRTSAPIRQAHPAAPTDGEQKESMINWDHAMRRAHATRRLTVLSPRARFSFAAGALQHALQHARATEPYRESGLPLIEALESGALARVAEPGHAIPACVEGSPAWGARGLRSRR